jgi:streptogramin lyase
VKALHVLLATGAAIVAAGAASAGTPEEGTWRYYRPSNTGIQGDYSEAVWIAPDGDPIIAAYNPFFEEGGFARFIQAENRWENYSNVDYPVIGDPDLTGSARIHDIVEHPDGTLWMATWRGALHFDPAVGAASIERYDAASTVHPGGRSMDVDVAPDGSVWFAVLSVSWGTGGLVRYQPAAEAWTWWGFGMTMDGWPSLTASCDALSVQPRPGGAYTVWIHSDNTGHMISFDSVTGQFTELPRTGAPGELSDLPGRDATDDAGNTWMWRVHPSGWPYVLDYRRPDGTFVSPPQIASDISSVWVFKAFGDRQALLVDGDSQTWRFNGVAWSSLGTWRSGAYSVGIDIDEDGTVWICGTGGAAKRDPATGAWQRYRITNTSALDFWVRDLSVEDPTGKVWVTGNAGTGVGGFQSFDGTRWYCFDNSTYGLGGSFPFPTDNTDAIAYRPSNGHITLNPMFNGIHEWTGTGYVALESGTTSEGFVEDSTGRLWSLGEYFSLRYWDGASWVPVGIDGWGRNIQRDPERPGTVWAAANFEVVRTDGSYTFSRVVNDFPELNPVSDYISTVAAAPGGVAWVGTRQGLIRIDTETGAYDFYSPASSDIPGENVSPLAVTPDGRVWFANFQSTTTSTWGLCWFDGTNFGIYPGPEGGAPQRGGLPHAQIADLEVRTIAGGYELWMSCLSRGIAVLTMQTSPAASVAEESPAASLLLAPGRPNPFRDATSFSFRMPEAGPAGLRVFDVGGRLLRTLASGSFTAGEHRVTWDGRDDRGHRMGAGVYFCRLEAAGGTSTRRVVLTK